MDLRRFEFDHDLTWYVFFLNADETIYGRYGGRDATDAEARISMKGLRYAMDRALEAHKSPAAPRRVSRASRSAPRTSRRRRSTAGASTATTSTSSAAPTLKAAGTWDRDEHLGLPAAGERRHHARRGRGQPREGGRRRVPPAEQAGLKPGDRLARLNGYSVASFARRHVRAAQGAGEGLDRRCPGCATGRSSPATLEVADGLAEDEPDVAAVDARHPPVVPFSGDD